MDTGDVDDWLARRHLNLQFTGSNTGGTTWSTRMMASSELHIYSGQLSLSSNELAPTSTGWLKILRPAGESGYSSHSPEVATWRNYSTMHRSCTSVARYLKCFLVTELSL